MKELHKREKVDKTNKLVKNVVLSFYAIDSLISSFRIDDPKIFVFKMHKMLQLENCTKYVPRDQNFETDKNFFVK